MTDKIEKNVHLDIEFDNLPIDWARTLISQVMEMSEDLEKSSVQFAIDKPNPNKAEEDANISLLVRMIAGIFDVEEIQARSVVEAMPITQHDNLAQHASQRLAREIVRTYYNEQQKRTNFTVRLDVEDIRIVWFHGTPRAWRAMLTTDHRRSLHYEVSYHTETDRITIEVYEKQDTIAVNDIDEFLHEEEEL